jgi:hypothetical protein
MLAAAYKFAITEKGMVKEKAVPDEWCRIAELPSYYVAPLIKF